MIELPVHGAGAPAPPPPRPLPWLPPWIVLAAHLAHASSWALLLGLWATGRGPASFAAFAWPHLVGLGWLSVLSLGVMCHVIPGFLDVTIPVERFARAMMGVAWIGALVLAAGFWFEQPGLLPVAGTIALVGLLGASGPMAAAIWSHRRSAEPATPLVPAFLSVLVSLVVAAGLGSYLAAFLAGHLQLGFPLPALASAHGHWAVGGWLTLLVFGVSTRTLRRIVGAPPARWHGAASALLSIGILLLGVAWLVPAPWVPVAGSALALAGALAYAAETGLRLAQGRGPHQAPRAYVAAGVLYLAIAAVLGFGTALGQPWGAGYVFLALAGWLGQSVNGHLMHIGTRFLATLARGDDDATPPWHLLSPALSWAGFGCFQAAVVCGAGAALSGLSSWAGASGALGLAGWTIFSANAALAWRRARVRVPELA